MNPLLKLHDHGQSVWLDYIRRDLIAGGNLRALVDRDGLRGVTSNPTIFEKAIEGSVDYDAGIDDYDAGIDGLMARNPHAAARELYDALAIEDVRNAADVLRPSYEETDGADGFVSIEPPPQLTRDTAGTIAEAQRLWRTVDRPNLMIKVVATTEGISAVEALISAGINVNITLMFSLRHYEAVATAYIRGLERCQQPARVASVASLFVSRVDTHVDRSLDAIGGDEAPVLHGKIAIANAKIVYRRFREIFYGDLFQAQRKRGARVQRPLWASTSTKNPHYRDVLYVEELVGPDTVNTMPPETLAAFRDHGQVRSDTVVEDLAESQAALNTLARLGLDLDAITEKLQVDGISSFAADYDRVLAALERKRLAIANTGPGRRTSGHGG